LTPCLLLHAQSWACWCTQAKVVDCVVGGAGGGEEELGTDMDLGGGDGDGGGLFSQIWDVFSNDD